MKKTKLQKLEIELSNLKAHDLFNLFLAKKEIDKMTEMNYMASGVKIEIKDLSGKILTDFLISDGLKKETIDALKNEIEKTTKIRLSYIGKG